MNKDKTENVQSQQCESVRELLSPYIDRQVSLDERQQVETHLAGCATCQGELDQIRAVVTGLKAMPQMAVPRSFALPASAARRPLFVLPRQNLVYLRGLAASLAACLILILGLGTYIDATSPGSAVMRSAVEIVPASAPEAPPAALSAPSDAGEPTLGVAASEGAIQAGQGENVADSGTEQGDLALPPEPTAEAATARAAVPPAAAEPTAPEPQPSPELPLLAAPPAPTDSEEVKAGAGPAPADGVRQTQIAAAGEASATGEVERQTPLRSALWAAQWAVAAALILTLLVLLFGHRVQRKI
jgi:hypothetical protein